MKKSVIGIILVIIGIIFFFVLDDLALDYLHSQGIYGYYMYPGLSAFIDSFTWIGVILFIIGSLLIKSDSAENTDSK